MEALARSQLNFVMKYFPLLLFVFLFACNSLHAFQPITAMALAPSKQEILIGSQAGLDVRGIDSLASTRALPTKLTNIHHLAFSPDENQLLAAGGIPGEDGSVEIWKWPEGELVTTLSLHRDLVYAVAWKSDGKAWATASADGTCKVVDTRTHKEIVHFQGHSKGVLTLAFIPNTQQILSGSVDQTIRLWDSVSGKQIRSFDNHLASVTRIEVLPKDATKKNQEFLSISDDRTMRLWHADTGRLVRFVKLPSIPIGLSIQTSKRLAWTSTDNRATSVSLDVFEVKSHKQLNSDRIHEILMLEERNLLMMGTNDGIQKLELVSKDN